MSERISSKLITNKSQFDSNDHIYSEQQTENQENLIKLLEQQQQHLSERKQTEDLHSKNIIKIQSLSIQSSPKEQKDIWKNDRYLNQNDISFNPYTNSNHKKKKISKNIFKQLQEKFKHVNIEQPQDYSDKQRLLQMNGNSMSINTQSYGSNQNLQNNQNSSNIQIFKNQNNLSSINNINQIKHSPRKEWIHNSNLMDTQLFDNNDGIYQSPKNKHFFDSGQQQDIEKNLYNSSENELNKLKQLQKLLNNNKNVPSSNQIQNNNNNQIQNNNSNNNNQIQNINNNNFIENNKNLFQQIFQNNMKKTNRIKVQYQNQIQKRKDFFNYLKQQQNYENIYDKTSIQVFDFTILFNSHPLQYELFVKSQQNLKQYQIKFLIFNDNNMNDISAFNILSTLKQKNLIQLMSITYNKNELGNQFFDILRNEMLLEFRLFQAPINKYNDNFKNIADLEHLQYLSLVNCNLNPQLIGEVLYIIQKQRKLISLDLSQNNFSALNFCLICEHIIDHSELQYFNFSQNAIGNALSVSNVLELQQINLVKCFNKYSCLRHIEMNSCKLSFQDSVLLLECFLQCLTLEGIHLSGNDIDQERLDEFCTILKSKEETFFVKYQKIYQPTIYNSDYPISKNSVFNYLITIFTRKLEKELTISDRNWKLVPNCWICERWRKTTLKIKSNQITAKLQQNLENLDENQKINIFPHEKINFLANLNSKSINNQNKSQIQNIYLNISYMPFDIIGPFQFQQIQKQQTNPTTGNQIGDNSDDNQEIHFTDYMPPGLVKYKILPQIKNFSYIFQEQILVRQRELDQLTNFQQQQNFQKIKIEFFSKQNSILKNLQLDNIQIIAQCFDYDEKCLLQREFFKVNSNLIIWKNLRKIVSKFEVKIMQSYKYLQSHSKLYPYIDWETLNSELQTGQIYDQYLNLNQARNVYKSIMKDNRLYNRFLRSEYIEFLIRIAIIKYMSDNELYSEGLLQFMIIDFLPNFYFEDFIRFRLDVMLTEDVSHLIYSNYVIISKIYNHFGNNLKHLEIFCKQINIQSQDENWIKINFALCKKTIIFEKEEENNYFIYEIEEFFEFLIRLSFYLYPENSLSLTQKINNFFQLFI